jgi:uncharacterized protein YbcI
VAEDPTTTPQEGASTAVEGGSLVARLSREMVKFHARAYGRGPTKAKSTIHRDYALCILEEIFTTAERTLIDAGSGDHVRETRQRFQDAMEEEMIALAEGVTGRPIRTMLSQVDIRTGVASELFLFEPEAGPEV